MNQKTSPTNIDSLIKKIYSSYIEIKSGDFREIEKDNLLRNIQDLYAAIKGLYPNEVNNQIESDIQSNHTVKEEEIVLAPVKIVAEPIKTLNVEPKIEIKVEPIVESKPEPIVTKTIEQEPLKAEPKAEIVENTKVELNTKPVDVSAPPTPQPIEHQSYLPKSDPKPEPKIQVEDQIQTTEKKSTKQIMDFLHDEPGSKTTDLYTLLDINTRIGIVEQFFKGDTLLLSECFSKLNQLKSRSESIETIQMYARALAIKQDSEIFQSFITLIDRKFIYNK